MVMKPKGMIWRLLWGFSFLSLGLLSLISNSAAKEYPLKPIVVVVNFPAGSSTGLTGQKLANIINQNKFLPQPMQLMYKPGGAGTIAVAEVVQGKADGYTLAYTPSAPILVQPLVKELPYNHRTLIPVVQTIRYPWLYAVKSDTPWKNVQEFLEYAKTHPGEVMVATAGDYTWGHVALLDLMKASGLKFRHVPLQGDVGTITALLGGHVPVGAVTGGSLKAHVAAGKLRLLASAETERSPSAPDVPTMKELGFDVKGTTHTNFLIAPKGTPVEIVETLSAAFKKAIDTNDFAAFMKDVGGSPGYVGFKELPTFIESVVKETSQLLGGIGVKVKQTQ
jgi:tripartite-type tricarboxylate transporter receptor subunit TctC